jgi:acyl carrier protein
LEELLHQDAISDRLRDVLESQLGILVPRTDTDLISTGIIDSLALVELLFEAEAEFGVRIDLESFDIEHARTLDRMASWIHAQQGTT